MIHILTSTCSSTDIGAKRYRLRAVPTYNFPSVKAKHFTPGNGMTLLVVGSCRLERFYKTLKISNPRTKPHVFRCYISDLNSEFTY